MLALTSPQKPSAPSKPMCQYGAKCYRKNPQHLAEFDHPNQQSQQEDKPRPVAVPTRRGKIVDEEDDDRDSKPAKTSAPEKRQESEPLYQPAKSISG